MIGYLDRTWCPGHIHKRCSRSQGCYRVFTPEDRANAIKWWGGDDFPIAIYAEEPSCFIPIHVDSTDGES